MRTHSRVLTSAKAGSAVELPRPTETALRSLACRRHARRRHVQPNARHRDFPALAFRHINVEHVRAEGNRAVRALAVDRRIDDGPNPVARRSRLLRGSGELEIAPRLESGRLQSGDGGRALYGLAVRPDEHAIGRIEGGVA